jgi:putative glutamine amidotransferase
MPRIAIPVPTVANAEYNQGSSPSYAEAVREAGGTPVELPLNLPLSEIEAIAATCQGILLPGSPADVAPARYGQDAIPECNPADPARESVDTLLLEHAERLAKPLLCICFGAQSLNVHRGGTLVQHLTPMPVNHRAGRAVAVAHTVAIAPDSLLGGLILPAEAPLRDGFLQLPVNSSHHQAIGAPGDNLHVVARSVEDGVIEAVEGGDTRGANGKPAHWLLGLQWHPERTTGISPASRAIFTSFLAAASVWKTQP